MEGYQNFDQNFDASQLAADTSHIIMFIAVIDKSPSIHHYEDSMNTATTELFMQEFKNCHRKNEIVVKCIQFNEDVDHVSGFQPVLSLKDDYLVTHNCGRSTALYKAVWEALNAAEQYRKDLEDQGIIVRTNIFIITDGEDREDDGTYAKKVRDKVVALRSNEAWIKSFTITMLGVGQENIFRQSCITMGLNPDLCLSTIGATSKELREKMGVVSQSVSSSTAGAGVTF